MAITDDLHAFNQHRYINESKIKLTVMKNQQKYQRNLKITLIKYGTLHSSPLKEYAQSSELMLFVVASRAERRTPVAGSCGFFVTGVGGFGCANVVGEISVLFLGFFVLVCGVLTNTVLPACLIRMVFDARICARACGLSRR